jgi:hypothetical protein
VGTEHERCAQQIGPGGVNAMTQASSSTASSSATAKKQWVDSADLLYSKSSQGKTPGLMMKDDGDVLIALGKDYGGLDPVKPGAEYYTNEFFDCK